MGMHDLLVTADLRAPVVGDGAAIRELAFESGGLDVNSAYFYLLWCRDFSATSVVAWLDGGLAGFLLAYLRPDQPGTLYVWQVATRIRGLGVRMLDELVDRASLSGVRFLEATVTTSNHRSIAMFERFARQLGTRVHRSELFAPNLFPPGHEAEILLRIGPL